MPRQIIGQLLDLPFLFAATTNPRNALPEELPQESFRAEAVFLPAPLRALRAFPDSQTRP
jgi:hypothetical protein